MTLEKALKYVLTGGTFLVLLTPFLFSKSLYFPYITTKAYFFFILVEILVAVWISLAIINPEYRPKRSWILWSLSAFVVIIGIANFFGFDRVHSLWSNFERMEGYLTLLHVFALFFVLGASLQTEKLWNWFLNTAVVASVVQAGWALLQSWGALSVGMSADRIDGTMGNATYLAIYMVLSTFITLWLLLRHRGQASIKYAYIAAILLQIIALILTATRGSLLGLIGGMVVTFVLISLLERQQVVLRRITVGVLIVTALFATLVLGFKDSALVQDVNAFRRIADISLTETTTYARFINWSIAWEGIKERPVLGYGQGNYGFVFDKHYDPRMWAQEPWFDRVHNIVLDWLIAGGFLGLLAYLSIFVALLYYIWRPASALTKIERSVLTGMLAAYTFHNLFVFDNLVSYIHFMIILALVHGRVARPFTGVCTQKIQQSVAMPVVIVLLAIGLPYMVYAVNADSLRTSKLVVSALRPASLEDVPSRKALFEEAIAYNTHGTTETRIQLINFTGQVLRSELPIEVKEDFVNFAISEAEEEINIHPDQARFMILAGQFVAQIGDLDVAYEIFEKAAAITPTKQLLYQPMIEILLQQEKFEEALTLAKEVYELETENNGAWSQYVRAAARAKEMELYDALIAEAFETGRGQRVVELAKRNLEQDPTNAQAYASLAAAYMRAEMPEEAIAVFQELGEKIPAAKAQADQVIEDIRAGGSGM